MAKDTGRWKNLGLLVESGQAWLYKVEDREGEHSGVLVQKVLKNKKRIERFNQEIAVTQGLYLAGRRVVRILASGEQDDGGRAFYVMPYYPQGDLRATIRARSPWGDLAWAVRSVRELHRIVSSIHPGVAHRDLKPENVLIDETGFLLTDLGLCLLMQPDAEIDRKSDTLEQIGSRHYIAPEGLGGYRSVTNPVALDVYAIGKIAYELAAGTVLPGIETPVGKNALTAKFGGTSEWRRFNALVSGLVAHSPDVRLAAWEQMPDTLDRIEKSLESRPATHEDIVDELLAAVEGNVSVLAAGAAVNRKEQFDNYKSEVYGAIRAGLSEIPGLDRLRSKMDENKACQIEVGTGLMADVLPIRSMTTAPNGFTKVPGETVPFVRATWRTPMPSVTLAADVWATSDLSLIHINLVLYQNRHDGVTLIGRPKQKHVGSAHVGDALFVEKCREAATEMGPQWMKAFLASINGGS